MRKYILILIFIFIEKTGFCQSFINSFVVKVKTSDSGMCSLKFIFQNHQSNTFDAKCIIVWSAISIELSHKENASVLKSTELLDLCRKIEHSQFIIENTKGKCKLYSDLKVFEGEVFNVSYINASRTPVDTLNFAKAFEKQFDIKGININRLKVEKNDENDKILYVFVPSENEKLRGFKRTIFVSDWLFSKDN